MYISPTSSYWDIQEDNLAELDNLYNDLYYGIMDQCKTFPQRLEWIIGHLPAQEEDDFFFYAEDPELFEKRIEQYIEEQIKEMEEL